MSAAAGSRSGPRLRESELRTLRELCDTLVAPAPGGESAADLLSASARGVDQAIARIVEEYLSESQRAEFRRLLAVADSRLYNLLLSGRPDRFGRLAPARRERYLEEWSRSRLVAKRRGFHAIKRLTLFLFYATGGAVAEDTLWPAIGYEPSAPPAPAEMGRVPAQWIPRPRPEEEFVADVAIVGSGAGGALIAARLAERGHSVILLEQGPYLRGSEFPRTEAEGFDRLLHSHGLLTTADLAIGVLAGRVAGGSTTVNWMTCLRTPPEVLSEWAGRGLGDVVESRFTERFDRVEARLGVTTADSQRNPSNEALAVGCERLGYRLGTDYEVLPRNARGCRERCQPCSFGCPYDAKQSTLVTYLDDALARGVRLVCEARADRIDVLGGRAAGLEATYTGAGGPFPLRVRARAVVAAGSAIETPALLLRSGVRGAVGQGLHLHPTTALWAEYDRPIKTWSGPMQTIAVRRLVHRDPGMHGPWLESAPAHPGLAALALPWRGSNAHRATMRRVSRAAATIVLVRDTEPGRVTITADGAPRLEYRLGVADRENLVAGLEEAARIHRAAGAVRLATLHTLPIEVGDGGRPVSEADVDRLIAAARSAGIREHSIALFSAHPTGSAHAGDDPRRDAARPSGEVYGVDGLWIGDGSLLPTAPGVNPMISIMALADRTADAIDASLHVPASPRSGRAKT